MRGRGISPSIKTMKPNEKERILFMLFVGYDICIFVMSTTDDGIGPV